MKNEKSCGAICFFYDNTELKVLLVQHKLGGHWAFPKGHVEKNELEYETAIREVKEETSVDIEILNGFRKENIYSPAKNILKKVVYFVAISNNIKTKPQPEEIRATNFINTNEAMQILTYPADKKLLAQAIEFYESHI